MDRLESVLRLLHSAFLLSSPFALSVSFAGVGLGTIPFFMLLLANIDIALPILASRLLERLHVDIFVVAAFSSCPVSWIMVFFGL